MTLRDTSPIVLLFSNIILIAKKAILARTVIAAIAVIIFASDSFTISSCKNFNVFSTIAFSSFSFSLAIKSCDWSIRQINAKIWLIYYWKKVNDICIFAKESEI